MQLHLAKVNLNAVVSPKSLHKKRSYFQEVSTKRLRYCYKKRQIQQSSPQPIKISYKFTDQKCFHSSNRNQINVMRQSNLLQKQSVKEMNKEIDSMADIAVNSHLKNKSTRIINVQIINQQQFSKERPNSAIKNKIKVRSKSSFDNSNNDRDFSQRNQRHNMSKQQHQNINPYTKQQYLYFRKKQKEKMKKNILQIKKNQMLHNILKPCQIFQKQIKIRDHSRILQTQSDSRFYSHQNKKRRKQQLHRTLTARPKQDDGKLQPWQFKPWNLHEDCFI